MTDDLDGTTDARTVAFSFDGTNYEIDLSKKNVAAFEKALKPYIQAARPTSPRARRSAAPARARRRRGSSAPDTSAVRAWAAENGIEVSTRGRISAAVVEQYRAAH